MAIELIKTCARRALDFALPPRCAGCGTIVDEVHSFCADRWSEVEFLGETGCKTCGLPLKRSMPTPAGCVSPSLPGSAGRARRSLMAI
jgi:predicted amidophosphoribosyltransferase